MALNYSEEILTQVEVAIENRQSKIRMNLTELLESVRRAGVRTNRLVNDTMVGA